MTSFAPADFLEIPALHAPLAEEVTQAWEIIPRLAAYLEGMLQPGLHGTCIGQPVIGDRVYIGEGTVIEPGAYIKGPAWIGPGCQIRHGAYIRENVIVCANSVVGNSSEVKNSFLGEGCQVPHFNYVGDSVLGARVHLAAGVILSNLKLNGGEIAVADGAHAVKTGLRKFGALIGDDAEIGCHAVLNPGSIIGRGALIYPGVSWRGVLAARSIAKSPNRVMVRK